MADLISDGGEFSCNFCTSKLKLTVTSSSSTGDSKKLANQSNCFFPPPGGNCTFPPGVPPSPCPGIPPGSVIAPGQSTVKIDQQTALGDGCKFLCPKGQVVLSKAGQTIAKHDEASGGLEALSLIADFIPFAGSAKSVGEVMTGKDPITRQETNRLGSAAGIILGIIPGGKILTKGKRAAKLLKNGTKKIEKGAASTSKISKKTLGKGVGKYEPAPYHKRTNSDLKSRGPVNGQEALDNSIQVKSSSPRRVGVDPKTGDFVVFDKTSENIYHGHVRDWKDLHPDMQNSLQKANIVTNKRKIVK